MHTTTVQSLMADIITETPTPGNITGNSTSAAAHVVMVISWLTFWLGLSAIGLALYILRNLSKGDTSLIHSHSSGQSLLIYTSECTNYCEGVPITNFQPCALHPGESKVPVHVIFLLVSDVISFFSCPRVTQDTQNNTILSSSGVDFLFYFGVVSNITLMVFIAQEHHLLVAYPKCHGCCTRIRLSPAVTFLAWAAPFAMLALAVPHYNFWFAVCFLAPFPFLLFLAVDSWRALHCSRSNPPTPERRTAWGIGAIWANYTFLYSPFILSILLEALSFTDQVYYLGLVSHLLLYLSPLVDPFLYIFMTKGPKEVLLVLPCCQNSRKKVWAISVILKEKSRREFFQSRQRGLLFVFSHLRTAERP
nr:uncharacterized protein si:ch211-132e22.4 [Nothobranchius furzeri]